MHAVPDVLRLVGFDVGCPLRRSRRSRWADRPRKVDTRSWRYRSWPSVQAHASAFRWRGVQSLRWLCARRSPLERVLFGDGRDGRRRIRGWLSIGGGRQVSESSFGHRARAAASHHSSAAIRSSSLGALCLDLADGSRGRGMRAKRRGSGRRGEVAIGGAIRKKGLSRCCCRRRRRGGRSLEGQRLSRRMRSSYRVGVAAAMSEHGGAGSSGALDSSCYAIESWGWSQGNRAIKSRQARRMHFASDVNVAPWRSKNWSRCGNEAASFHLATPGKLAHTGIGTLREQYLCSTPKQVNQSYTTLRDPESPEYAVRVDIKYVRSSPKLLVSRSPFAAPLDPQLEVFGPTSRPTTVRQRLYTMAVALLMIMLIQLLSWPVSLESFRFSVLAVPLWTCSLFSYRIMSSILPTCAPLNVRSL